MGLKQEAGQVEQRYRGDTFAGIWDEVTPDTASEICALKDFELRRDFRSR